MTIDNFIMAAMFGAAVASAIYEIDEGRNKAAGLMLALGGICALVSWEAIFS